MNEIRVQNLSINELNKMIMTAVSEAVQPFIPDPEPETKYLTRKETADLLGISLVTLNDWTKKGVIKAYRINTRIRYKSNEVEKAINEVESLKFKRK